jgi:hypothetical protein
MAGGRRFGHFAKRGIPRSIPLEILLIHPTLSRTLKPSEPTMTIEIRDASLEARIRKQLQATGSSSVEEGLLRLLDTQEEQDRWLLENREEINAKIRRGIAQLDRGEGFQKTNSTPTSGN